MPSTNYAGAQTSSRSCSEDTGRGRAGPVPRIPADDAATANCAVNRDRMNRPRLVSVGPEKDIAERIAQPVGDPALCQMMVAVMDHMAALAEAPQIAQPVVLRVVVEMRDGQGHPRRAHLDRLDERGLASWRRPLRAISAVFWPH
jgi:hypothetical protein